MEENRPLKRATRLCAGVIGWMMTFCSGLGFSRMMSGQPTENGLVLFFGIIGLILMAYTTSLSVDAVGKRHYDDAA